MKCPFVMPMTRCPPDKRTLGYYYSPLSKMDTIVTHYATNYLATSALKIPDMVSPQRTLRYPYNKVQGPPIIVGWTVMVSTTPAWGIEPTTSSLGAMSPYHQAKAMVLNVTNIKVKQQVVGPLNGEGWT